MYFAFTQQNNNKNKNNKNKNKQQQELKGTGAIDLSIVFVLWKKAHKTTGPMLVLFHH